jgi:hypothetical protein
MSKLLIMPQDWPKRLHEWVAMERGYFDEEGLDFRFQATPPEWDDMVPGGFVRELHEELVRNQTTGFCDCSWGVLASTGAGAGRFVPDYFTEAHLCIYARPDSGITRPEELADRPLGVCELSGSHFSTLEAVERYVPRDRIRLHFVTARYSDAAFYFRVKALLDGDLPAVSLLDIPNGPLRQVVENHGMRLILESTFKRLDYFSADATPDAMQKFSGALRKAQAELDRNGRDYLHYLWREVPRLEDLFHTTIDVHRITYSPRVVFERFTEEEFAATLKWMEERGLAARMGSRDYDRLALCTPA